jgi:hypothetical protein
MFKNSKIAAAAAVAIFVALGAVHIAIAAALPGARLSRSRLRRKRRGSA